MSQTLLDVLGISRSETSKVEKEELDHESQLLVEKYCRSGMKVQSKLIAIKAYGYICISPQMIIDSITKQVTEKENKAPSSILAFDRCEQWKDVSCNGSHNIDVYFEWGGFIYSLSNISRWIETSIEKYREIPPLKIATTMEKVIKQSVFDYITVAKVEIGKTIRIAPFEDPLLIGRLNGNNDRFVIDQWE